MGERTCKDCRWFAAWPVRQGGSWWKDATGVCTAPRPSLGPQPQREVNHHSGKGCPMNEEASE